VVSWLDKKAMNILTNAFEQPQTAEWKNGRPVPNFIKAYRNTLNFVDGANAYRLRYRFLHRVFKHTHAQFITILYLAFVNSWLIYKHVNNLQQSKKWGSYRTFFRHLMEWLAQAGGEHRLRNAQQQKRDAAIRAVAGAAAAAAAAAAADTTSTAPTVAPTTTTSTAASVTPTTMTNMAASIAPTATTSTAASIAPTTTTTSTATSVAPATTTTSTAAPVAPATATTSTAASIVPTTATTSTAASVAHAATGAARAAVPPIIHNHQPVTIKKRGLCVVCDQGRKGCRTICHGCSVENVLVYVHERCFATLHPLTKSFIADLAPI